MIQSIVRMAAFRTTAACICGLLVALAARSQPAPVPSPERPNLILILADDMGYGDIGAFGSKLNRTPNLDRMAREGMRLTSFYACPVCTPSRAQFMTGCYAKRVSLPTVIFPSCPIGLNPDEATLPRLLKDQGYATMAIGKWHLGDQREFLPPRYGFDHYFGLPYSNDMGGGEDWPPVGSSRVTVGVPGALGVTGRPKPPLPLVRDSDVVEVVTPAQQDLLTKRYTDEAVKFIRSNAKRPFFLYMPHTAVHVPLHPGAKFRGKSANGTYGDWVEEMDWSVGEVLDAVRSLKLERRTLVLFTSDNGPWLTQGHNGGTAGPLRGGKGSTWEGGMREPTIAWWPGVVAPGTQSDAVAANLDVLPTFVRLAGGAVPTAHRIDGVDIAPILRGEASSSTREALYYFNGDTLEAVRSGAWKLAVRPQDEHRPGAPSPGRASGAGQSPRLYNLVEDIGESMDVAAQHPDEVARLARLAAAMETDLGGTGRGPGVRPPGRVANPKPLLPAGYEAVVDTDSPAPPSPERLAGLRIGDTLDSRHAPQIARTPFSISVEVEPAKPDGIILAQGGSKAGVALHLRAGHVIFTVRERGVPTSIASPGAPAGKFTIKAALAAGGMMTLSIDGVKAAEGKVSSLLNGQPQENFCLGFDDGALVADYGAAGRFTGKITRLRIATGRAAAQ